jgi:hypothetical protein
MVLSPVRLRRRPNTASRMVWRKASSPGGGGEGRRDSTGRCCGAAGLLAILVLGHFSWELALALVPWGVCAFWFATRLGYKPWVGWPLALAGLLAAQCWLETPPSVRQHDVEGHREYIDYLSAEGKLPAVTQGWETYQPPLYYAIAAVWRWAWAGIRQNDPFRSVQVLAAVLYVATVGLSLVAYRRFDLEDVEAVAAAGILALTPGYVFFAARINNDVLLPLLGAGVMLLAGNFVQSRRSQPLGLSWEDETRLPLSGGNAACPRPQRVRWSGVLRVDDNPRSGCRFLASSETRLLVGLSLLLAATLATKGSSLAMVGGALALIFWFEGRRSDWHAALLRTYLTGLPAGLWLIFWCTRTAAQTGNPFYVNANLPASLRILASSWRRMLSFKFGAFLGGNFYYDAPMRHSYFTALVTSCLYGEYGMGGYAFRCPQLLRWGGLGVILILLTGAVLPPRRELKPAWIICLCLAVCQTAITVAYAIEYPYACNQNMRFFAQAFVPFAGLLGLGVGRWWSGGRWWGRAALGLVMGAFLAGVADLYARILF